MTALLLAFTGAHPRPGSTDSHPFPYQFGPGALPKILLLIVLGFLAISLWHHYRPCGTCGEYREQCRCKARKY